MKRSAAHSERTETGQRQGSGPDQASRPLAGERVAVTGAMHGPLSGVVRSHILALITEAGGTPCRAVSGRTTMLIASRQDTRKSVRARQLGLPVLTPGELAAIDGYPTLW
ncbi:MAG: hypothetical protein M3Y35_02550 [Actinomycetota bacterium]|nr:hypothetical protein [Actinomycetota bacterium]